MLLGEGTIVNGGRIAETAGGSLVVARNTSSPLRTPCAA